MEDYTIDEHPLRCPKCHSPHVTYTKDASLAFIQKSMGDVIGRSEGAPSEFDETLDAECLECHFCEAPPSTGWWE